MHGDGGDVGFVRDQPGDDHSHNGAPLCNWLAICWRQLNFCHPQPAGRVLKHFELIGTARPGQAEGELVNRMHRVNVLYRHRPA